MANEPVHYWLSSSMTMQMAARDTGFGAVESLLHEGKLLALDLLYHILENPLHSWNNVRAEVSLSLLSFPYAADFCVCP